MVLMISTELSLIRPMWNAPKNVLAYASTRHGGASIGTFNQLNIGDHVGDTVASVKANRKLLPFSTKIQWMKQVHGSQTVTINSVSSYPVECDALVTKNKGLFCAVMTADCLPILVTTVSGDEVGAVHAGWKGLATGVIANCISAFSAKPSELLVWVGPAICENCYEVDCSVKQHFKKYPHAFRSKKNKRYDFNLSSVALLQLTQLGVIHVTLSNLCTYCDSERFYSHRRSTHQNESSCGRQVSVIGLL